MAVKKLKSIIDLIPKYKNNQLLTFYLLFFNQSQLD